MLKLCGFAVSNYYNKVKLSLLEKGIPFEEELAYPSQKEDFRKDSPMGKVPALEDGAVRIWDSGAICGYLADQYPAAQLAPPIGSPVREFLKICSVRTAAIYRSSSVASSDRRFATARTEAIADK